MLRLDVIRQMRPNGLVASGEIGPAHDVETTKLGRLQSPRCVRATFKRLHRFRKTLAAQALGAPSPHKSRTDGTGKVGLQVGEALIDDGEFPSAKSGGQCNVVQTAGGRSCRAQAPPFGDATLQYPAHPGFRQLTELGPEDSRPGLASPSGWPPLHHVALHPPLQRPL